MVTNEFVEIQKLLKTGDLVKLRTGTIHGQRSYNGRVADICDDVVTVVVPEDSPLLMRGPGAFKVVMRKETDNALYIFDSSATVRFSHNRPNLKLRIESEVQRVQRRWNVRLSVLIDPEEALLIDGDEEKPFKATILDLQRWRVLLHTSEPIATGAKLRLSFPLPGLSGLSGPTEVSGEYDWMPMAGSISGLGGQIPGPWKGSGGRHHQVRLPRTVEEEKAGALVAIRELPLPQEDDMAAQQIGTAKGPETGHRSIHSHPR